MEVKAIVRTMAPCRRTVRIEVPVAAWTARLEEVFQQIGRRAQIPGFRVGKAPPALVKERFARQAEEELLQQVVPDAVEAALTQQRLEPVVRPRVTEVGYADGKPLTLTAEVEIKPDVQPRGYRGLRLTQSVRTVTDEDVEQALRSFQERHAELVPVEGRAAAMDDYLLCDLTCTINGTTVEQAQQQWIRLASSPSQEALWSGVIQQLVGAQAGQALEVPITLPADYRQPRWAGQAALLRIAVREVKSKRLPPLDDELARAAGQWQTLAELRQAIRQELMQRATAESEEAVRHDALLALLKAMPSEAPPSLVEAEVEAMVAEAIAQAQAGRSAAAPPAEQIAAWRERLRPSAVDRVRLFFIIEAIARKEQVTVTQEEWRQQLVEVAGASRRPPEEVDRWLEQQGLRSRLRWQRLQRKVLDLVVRQARVETVERRDAGSSKETA